MAQRVSALLTVPHGWPDCATGCVTQIFIAVSHARPTLGSHAGPVFVAASQAVPAAAIRCMHEPIVVAVAPTHASETPHGRSLLHAPASATGTWQSWVEATQFIVGPQAWLAQEAPAAGGAVHVPHSAVLAIEQKPLEHCPPESARGALERRARSAPDSRAATARPTGTPGTSTP